ncbi:MAG: rRNA maturation RNase YbeY [Acidobacteriota bacterium]
MQIEVINRQRRYPIANQALARFAEAVLTNLALPRAQVSIVFVSDRQMRKLNKDFRAINKTTDVLSFSYMTGVLYGNETMEEEMAADRNASNAELSAATDPDYLGDVVISTETAARAADKLGLTFDQEVKTLILHGLLHLCGYDHETDNGEMEALEQKLRKRLLSSRLRRSTAAQAGSNH